VHSDIHFFRTHPAVELIEENQVFHISSAYKTANCQRQDSAIWNLQRINTHPITGMDGDYSYNQEASDVDAYIIDTYVTHLTWPHSMQSSSPGADYVVFSFFP
jgi:hypothetical protein